MDVSSLKITLPQSKSLQPARRSTACLLCPLWTQLSQPVHNRPKTAREVGRNPYLVRRAERVLFINSANSFVLFPCRTTRVHCRIAPLALPIILNLWAHLCAVLSGTWHLRLASEGEKPFSITAITRSLWSLLSTMILKNECLHS